MAIKIKASRKTTIILLAVLFLIVGGSGSYLLWRVNQEDTVAPIDSEAGGRGEYGDCTCTPGNTNKCTCGCEGLVACCEAGRDCNGKQKCYWPEVAFCNPNGTCGCNHYVNTQDLPPDFRCEDTYPTCTPKCPNEYEVFETDKRLDINCDYNYDNAEECYKDCRARCEGCENEYFDKVACRKIPKCGNGKIDDGEQCDPGITTTQCGGKACNSDCTCPEAEPENICDEIGANESIKLTPSSPAYCGDVKYEYVAADSDGVGTITVKLGDTTLDPYIGTDLDNSTRQFIVGTIPGKTYNCNTNEQTLTISWEDAKGASGTDGKCTRTIKYTPGANTCDGGGWDTDGNPGNTEGTRTYKYCENISYSATGEDSHGIGDMTVKLNNQSRSVKPVKTETTATVSEVLSSSSNCLAPGTYTLDISWVDKYGVGGSGKCALKTKFVVSEEIQPEWEIEKIPAELCIDENTENPKAELSYKIQIKNTGSVSGKITQIVDTLDKKVGCASVSGITDGGVCEDGVITWPLSSPLSDFGAGQSKEFSYKYIVNKESFGEYENLVTATVGATGTEGEKTIQDNSNITADCEINEPGLPTGGGIPGTGLFDESENIVTLGAIILFLGLGWTWLNRTYEIVNGKLVQRNKERFERRVVKN